MTTFVDLPSASRYGYRMTLTFPKGEPVEFRWLTGEQAEALWVMYRIQRQPRGAERHVELTWLGETEPPPIR